MAVSTSLHRELLHARWTFLQLLHCRSSSSLKGTKRCSISSWSCPAPSPTAWTLGPRPPSWAWTPHPRHCTWTTAPCCAGSLRSRWAASCSSRRPPPTTLPLGHRVRPSRGALGIAATVSPRSCSTYSSSSSSRKQRRRRARGRRRCSQQVPRTLSLKGRDGDDSRQQASGEPQQPFPGPAPGWRKQQGSGPLNPGGKEQHSANIMRTLAACARPGCPVPNHPANQAPYAHRLQAVHVRIGMQGAAAPQRPPGCCIPTAPPLTHAARPRSFVHLSQHWTWGSTGDCRT